MIKPMSMKENNRSYKVQVVYDIETVSATGEVLAIGATIMDDMFEEVFFFDTFDEFFDWLVDLECEGEIRVWAHNGWGFDHLFFVRRLADLGELRIITGVFEGGKVQAMTVSVYGKRFVLADSFAVFQCSLKRTCMGFCSKHNKLDLEGILPEVLYNRNKDVFFEYLRNDVLALSEAIGALRDTLRGMFESFGEIPNTVGGLAMRIFRMSLKRDVMTSSRALDSWERASYFGGLVGVVQTGIFQHVTAVDVNSMYPSVMVDQLYPHSYVGYWTYEYNSAVLGLWEVEYDMTGMAPIPWVYDVDVRSRCWKGRTIVDTETVEFMKGEEYYVRVVCGYVYLDVTDTLFSYLRNVYQMKSGSISRKTTAKYILNSTYGKFGQKHERTKLGTLDKESFMALVSKGVAINEYDFGRQQLYSWKEDSLSTNTFCVIATLVTLRARMKLFRTILDITRAGGKVCYYDTDSIHYIGDVDRCMDIHESRLGAWSYVFRDREAGYAGKKLYYYLGDEKKDGRVVAKGVSGFTMDCMRELIGKGKAEGSYVSCTSPAKVFFQGIHPGVFTKHSRTLTNEGER